MSDDRTATGSTKSMLDNGDKLTKPGRSRMAKNHQGRIRQTTSGAALVAGLRSIVDAAPSRRTAKANADFHLKTALFALQEIPEATTKQLFEALAAIDPTAKGATFERALLNRLKDHRSGRPHRELRAAGNYANRLPPNAGANGLAPTAERPRHAGAVVSDNTREADMPLLPMMDGRRDSPAPPTAMSAIMPTVAAITQSRNPR